MVRVMVYVCMYVCMYVCGGSGAGGNEGVEECDRARTVVSSTYHFTAPS